MDIFHIYLECISQNAHLNINWVPPNSFGDIPQNFLVQLPRYLDEGFELLNEFAPRPTNIEWCKFVWKQFLKQQVLKILHLFWK